MAEYALSNLICKRVTNENQCNTIGQRISSNLIRVAGSRIFSDETRAFVELVVNSIDATRLKHGIDNSVGKFGFGFYSILALIIGRPERHISIESRYIEGGNVQGYRATLRDRGNSAKDSNIYLSVMKIPFIGNGTGTKIYVNYKETGKVDATICAKIINNIRWTVREIRDVPIGMVVDKTCGGYKNNGLLINNMV